MPLKYTLHDVTLPQTLNAMRLKYDDKVNNEFFVYHDLINM